VLRQRAAATGWSSRSGRVDGPAEGPRRGGVGEGGVVRLDAAGAHEDVGPVRCVRVGAGGDGGLREGAGYLRGRAVFRRLPEGPHELASVRPRRNQQLVGHRSSETDAAPSCSLAGEQADEVGCWGCRERDAEGIARGGVFVGGEGDAGLGLHVDAALDGALLDLGILGGGGGGEGEDGGEEEGELHLEGFLSVP